MGTQSTWGERPGSPRDKTERRRKRCRRHFYSPSFSAPSSRIFLSSLPCVEPNVNSAHSATPRSGDPVLAGERFAASQEESLLPTGAPTSLRKATLASQR